jgi:hypothetical protein
LIRDLQKSSISSSKKSCPILDICAISNKGFNQR